MQSVSHIHLLNSTQEPNIRDQQVPNIGDSRQPNTYSFRTPFIYQGRNPFTYDHRSPFRYPFIEILNNRIHTIIDRRLLTKVTTLDNQMNTIFRPLIILRIRLHIRLERLRHINSRSLLRQLITLITNTYATSRYNTNNIRS